MRTYFKTTEVPKRIAKAVAHVFPALSLAKAQEWTAMMCGYRNWHELDMFTRNYTGEPTPDPFFVKYREELNNWISGGEKSNDLETKQEKESFQVDILQELMSFPSLAFLPGECHSEIMWLAHHGLSNLDRENLGKGSPLFNDLQYPWFSMEDQSKSVLEEGYYETEFDSEPISLFCGFANHHQLNRWLQGARKELDKTALAELRDDFPGIAKRVEGGSYIRLNKDGAGREVIVQSTKQRFWWSRDRDHRMLGGFTLAVKVIARRDSSDGDEFEFSVHDTWYDKSLTREQKDEGLWPLPHGEVAAMLDRFIRSRIGMNSMSCRIAVAYDRKSGSQQISKDLRDVVNDFTREHAGVDIDPFFEQQVIPYTPRYLTERFFVLESQLV